MNTASKFTGFKPREQQQKDKQPAKAVKDWKVGEKLVGFWQQDKEYDGQYGKILYHYLIKAEIDKKGNIVTQDEPVTLRSGAGLANQLKGLKAGQLVEITYEGKVKNIKTGQTFHKFTSQVADNVYVKAVTTPTAAKEDDNDFMEWDDEQ